MQIFLFFLDLESEIVPEQLSKKKSKSTTPADDDDSDDSYWDSDSDESSSSSDDDQPGMSLREKFLKKTTDKDKDKDKDKAEKKGKSKSRKVKVLDEDEDEDEDDDWIKVDRGALEKPKMFDKDAEITIDLVVKKLREIMAARGKKRTNRKEQIGKTDILSFIFFVHIIRACLGPSVIKRVSKCCYITLFRDRQVMS